MTQFSKKELELLRIGEVTYDEVKQNTVETILDLRDIHNLLATAKRIAERLPVSQEALMPPSKMEEIRDVLSVLVDQLNKRGLGVTIGLDLQYP